MNTPENNRTRRILIGTVGGQGGGVLSAWLVRGLINLGWDAISIGLLGLSQRAGTVTYYCEASPKSDKPRVNSMFAMAGDVDLLLGQELLELGRLIQGGYAAPDCVVIGNTYRYLTTLEKMPSENGIFESQRIVNAIRQVAPKSNYLVHAQEVVSNNQLPALTSNAFLLGAAVGSPVFDLPAEPFLEAIRADQVSVETNSKAFLLGYGMARDGRLAAISNAEWERLNGNAQKPVPMAAEKVQLTFQPEPDFSAMLKRVAGHNEAESALVAAGNLLESYQDAAYANEFVRRIQQLEVAAGIDFGQQQAEVFQPLCVNLANWMSYEDPIRVAQLKTSPRRFERLAAEFKGARGLLQVRDYMVPDMEQFVDALPPSLAGLFGRADERAVGTPAHRPAKFPIRLRSNSVLGYWTLRFLASLRWTRRASSRHQRELAAIDSWLAAIGDACVRDWRMALVLAEAGRIVRGYGWTRKKALADIQAFSGEGLARLKAVAARGGDTLEVGRAALVVLAKQAGSWEACKAFLVQAEGQLNEAPQQSAKAA